MVHPHKCILGYKKDMPSKFLEPNYGKKPYSNKTITIREFPIKAILFGKEKTATEK